MAEEHEKPEGETQSEGTGKVNMPSHFSPHHTLIVSGVTSRTLACELNFLITPR